MFFEAMRRKRFDPRADDMRAIVPIHNAVNERAWGEIKKWEKGRGGEACVVPFSPEPPHTRRRWRGLWSFGAVPGEGGAVGVWRGLPVILLC